MPGFDGSGPGGTGPMTGGGFGYCSGNSRRPGRGAGVWGGRGANCRGMGRGFGRVSPGADIEAKLDSILSRLEALEQKER